MTTDPDEISFSEQFAQIARNFMHTAHFATNHLNQREMALAKTKIEEALHWAEAGLHIATVPVQTQQLEVPVVDSASMASETTKEGAGSVLSGISYNETPESAFEQWNAFLEAHGSTCAAMDHRHNKSQAFPTGNVNGPCICGSWPGGECHHCATQTATGSVSAPDTDKGAPKNLSDQWNELIRKNGQ